MEKIYEGQRSQILDAEPLDGCIRVTMRRSRGLENWLAMNAWTFEVYDDAILVEVPGVAEFVLLHEMWGPMP